ncbi:hypothetical protein ABT186_25425 [Streptomyces sp. NPDC001634]|uniref:hypothetical protein n=1 Tax=Streptomyces sp. NPDC001634 TaxID=3154390 RepID=UPI003319DAA9
MPGRLLSVERDALIPLLRARPDASTRDTRRSAARSPFAERAGWTNAQVVDELERGMTEAGPVIARAGGVLDMIALGEWVHAGDVRETFREPGAYAGQGLPDALTLLVRVTREKSHLPLHADLDDGGTSHALEAVGEDEPLRLGDTSAPRTPARYIGEAATLVRLYAGRPVPGTGYEPAGAEAGELNIFG